MKIIHWVVLLAVILSGLPTAGQTSSLTTQSFTVDRNQFFNDERPVEMTISTDFRKMQSEKVKGIYQDGSISIRFPEGEDITENIRLYARGEFRRQNCRMPGLMVNFKNTASPRLSPLKKMKLTCGCGSSSNDEQMLLTEFLIYKMYNLVTDKSFRVRLARVNYKDVRGRLKEYTQYAFLLEDVDDMALRNNCAEVQGQTFLTEHTHRSQMTLVAIFQFMVGNTDWSVPNYHNVKLIRPLSDSLARPFVVPYDFDFTGLVNAHYAMPHPDLGIEKVTDRLYRGFSRTMPELQAAFDIFRNKKEKVIDLITNFELLRKRERDAMLNYIDDFYRIIENKYQVENYFINGARKN